MSELNDASEIFGDAGRLLAAIAGDSLVTFQTLDDTGKGRKALIRVMHGSLAKHLPALACLNAEGASINFMVNAGDGRGRTGNNVRSIRAVFVDLDGAPLQPVMECALRPHAVVESSPGRYHAYWFVAGLALSEFARIQASIASKFGGDRKVKDLPRVMRLPGSWHQKGEPFQSRILSLEERPRYTAEEVLAAFKPGVCTSAATGRHPRG